MMRAASVGWSGLQPEVAVDTCSRTLPCSVNLNAFDSKFFKHLLQALRIGLNVTVHARLKIELERQPARFRLMPERPGDAFEQIGEMNILGVHRDGAGFDLRQVENVGDQVQTDPCPRRGWCARTPPACH